MLSKLRYGGQLKNGGGSKRKLGIFSRMTLSSQPASPYRRMEGEAAVPEVRIKKKSQRCAPADPREADKKAKKKRSWKRFRQVALTTCRYIGMGAAHMSPATAYSSPDYQVDPKCWNKSFNPSYKPKTGGPAAQTPHWTSNLMFAGW